MARSSSFTQEIADEICERIAAGESVRRICKENEGMPATSTVMKWLAENQAFSEQYARAREMQAEAIFDEIADIADNASNDWMEHCDPDNPGYRLNGEHIQRSKLRVDARKWMLAKMLPKKYGDKQQIDHVSTDGSMSPLSSDEAIDKLMGVLGMAEQRAKQDAGED